MLSVEIWPKGGVKIVGTKADLRRLARLADVASVAGHCSAPYCTDEALSELVIELDREGVGLADERDSGGR